MNNYKIWTEEELQYLINNHKKKTCGEISLDLKRTTKSVQHKYNQLGLEKDLAKIGDIVKGWEVIETFTKRKANQNVTMAKLKAITNGVEIIEPLTNVTHGRITYANLRRIGPGTHYKTHTRLYRIWASMKNRCSNPKQGSFHNYGKRGIKVCKEWGDFNNFCLWAETNGYDESLTLDRINVDGDYCPENCRWATQLEQTINKKNIENLCLNAFGENKHVIEWSHDPRCKVSHPCLKYRIRAGWNPEDAITKEPERKQKLNLTNWLKKEYPSIYEEYRGH